MVVARARATIKNHFLTFQTSTAARGKRKSTPGTVSNRRMIQWGHIPGNVPPINRAMFRKMEADGKDTQHISLLFVVAP